MPRHASVGCAWHLCVSLPPLPMSACTCTLGTPWPPVCPWTPEMSLSIPSFRFRLFALPHPRLSPSSYPCEKHFRASWLRSARRTLRRCFELPPSASPLPLSPPRKLIGQLWQTDAVAGCFLPPPFATPTVRSGPPISSVPSCPRASTILFFSLLNPSAPLSALPFSHSHPDALRIPSRGLSASFLDPRNIQTRTATP